jgi:hypothetical protein
MEMNNEKVVSHPDITELAAYRAGVLGRERARTVGAHLAGCARCRLELKKYKRFETIDHDGELEAEAGWEAARFRLDRAFRERVLPAVLPQDRVTAGERKRAFSLNWLAPVAAAAAVILIFIHFENTRIELMPYRGMGPMRGETAKFEITLNAPSGEVKTIPEQFTWQSKRDDDYYTIEIFTANLINIYRVEHVEGSAWVVTDSLRSMFEPDSLYLWSVKGYKGLEREVTSPNGWFKITTGRAAASMTDEL